MPTPLEILMDPIAWIVLGIYGGLALWEAVAPAKPLPQVRGWRLRGLTTFFTFFFASTYLPLMWDGWLAQFQVFDLTSLGTWGGFAAGLLLYEAGVYVWHRTMHANDVLWRSVHQMHHSAERLDVWGSFWFGPLDMVGWTALGSLTLVVLIGVTPQAATLVILATTFFSVFQHANLRTPRWIGYLFQRPESHSVHHQRGRHRKNYSDLALFDMLFGTFENPRGHVAETGFRPGASARVVDMLLMRDVSEDDDASSPIPAPRASIARRRRA